VRYEAAGEYHLTVRAPGYREGGLYLQPIAEPRLVDGVVVTLEREGSASAVHRTRVEGVVTRGGVSLSAGRIGAWARGERGLDRVNGRVHRGRTVPNGAQPTTEIPIGPDGTYRVGFPPWTWWLAVDEPGFARTVAGPLVIGANDERVRFDVACAEPGAIEGRVERVPESMAGETWIVAFDGIQPPFEARVDEDGRFRLAGLSPGRYGLKAGHDAYEDPQIARNARLEDYETLVDPWEMAVVVEVRTGETARDAIVDFVAPAFVPKRPSERRAVAAVMGRAVEPGAVTRENVFWRTTNRARWALVGGSEIVKTLAHARVGPEHVLAALLEPEDGLIAGVFARLGVDRSRAREELLRRLPRGGSTMSETDASTAGTMNELLDRAVEEASRAGVDYVATDHLLLACVRLSSGVAAETLRDAGIVAERVRDAVEAELRR
jgi:ClpA/ClpB-like protein